MGIFGREVRGARRLQVLSIAPPLIYGMYRTLRNLIYLFLSGALVAPTSGPRCPELYGFYRRTSVHLSKMADKGSAAKDRLLISWLWSLNRAGVFSLRNRSTKLINYRTRINREHEAVIFAPLRRIKGRSRSVSVPIYQFALQWDHSNN